MKTFIPIFILIFVTCSSCNKEQEIESILDIRGNEIHYKSIGKGQEMFLVHGGYLDLEMWNPQIETFQKEKKIIRFSDVGHGNTIASNNEIYGFEIIEKLSKSTKEDPAILVGLSWGAMICIDYALNNPDKISKLILVSPGLNGWNYFQDTLAAKNNLLRQEATLMGDIDSAAVLFHKNWVIGPRRNFKDIDNDFYQKSLEMIKSNMKEHCKEDWSKLDSIPAIERLEQIEIPTYIIIGDEDADDIKLIASLYNDKIPNSKKIIMKDVAHLVNMEDTESFNQILRQILEL